MNFWIVENVSMLDFTDKIIKHNLQTGKLNKPSDIFRTIYKNINQPSNNKYVNVMKDLNDQMYQLVTGQRKEIVDYKQFNLPFTDVSVEFSYIYKVSAVVLQQEYIEFLLAVAKQLNLDVPDNIVDEFNNKLETYRNTFSPKYDKFYQLRTYYERVIRES